MKPSRSHESDMHDEPAPPPSGLTVIILTFNEERNLQQALDSVAGWSAQTLILDSYSTDRTLEIAKQYHCQVFQNRFENYAKQRNHALMELPIAGQWILFLDADEWLPEDLKTEITVLTAANPRENGFYVPRRMMWMGRWIRRGYYPTWILRLFRHGTARCEDRAINEHLIIDGEHGYLKNDLMHEDQKGITEWIAKHNSYASYEAAELVNNRAAQNYQEIDVRLFGTQAQRKRWIRYRLWNRLPPLLRPFLYFAYRYIFRAGFLDGKEGFIFHFLQALWFPLLVDIKYLEQQSLRVTIDNPGESLKAEPPRNRNTDVQG